ncbi:hypothetical protein F8M49_12700 [Rhodococcus zopfii]|uniref:O-acyltransferase WSD1-like N-terminal domain-containing protein n=1 Tax=Rhodococcus zopfii TaxID=43772 RepID=A0ABU3WPY6_9NOCA|nr:hypothetical protein [Rhodococcus zopfii]
MPKTNADTSSRARIERAGPADLTVLATDRGPVPMNIGAILGFDASPGPDLSTVSAHLAERIPRIPRLRQRLQRVPIGCGHPVWVDDPGFALEHHLTEQDWPAPAGERQLFDLAAEFVCTPPVSRSAVVAGATGGGPIERANRLDRRAAPRARRRSRWPGGACRADRQRTAPRRSGLSATTAEPKGAGRRCRAKAGRRCANAPGRDAPGIRGVA